MHNKLNLIDLLNFSLIMKNLMKPKSKN